MRWGLVATGSICRQFARDLPHVPGAICQAVASRGIDKASAFAEEFGFVNAYGSYHELFADPDVDVVYIGTPHPQHLANASDAMRAGKHVLCEKPLTVLPEESRELAQVSQETGRYLMEAMWTWYLPAVLKAQEWVADGRIGELRHVKADFGYPQRFDPQSRMYSPELAGGCLLDMGVYPIALSWLFHKAKPLEMTVTGRRAPSGVDDDFSAVLRFENHTATLGSSFRCKLQNWAYLVGTDGYIAIPDFWRASEAKLFELDTCVEHFKDPRAHQGFAFEAIALQEDVAAGKLQSDVVSHADSIAIQELMDEVRRRI